VVLSMMMGTCSVALQLLTHFSMKTRSVSSLLFTRIARTPVAGLLFALASGSHQRIQCPPSC
jgi:hypothetical protein